VLSHFRILRALAAKPLCAAATPTPAAKA
jgi:hypothetical protein